MDKLGGQMELRRIPPTYRSRLCEMLSTDDQWKVVMAAVPTSFAEDGEFQHKYTTDHVNIIENYSRQTGKLGMDILLDEWGTSGRVRPTVSDLYLLCSSLELYRAADFLLEQLMSGNKPTRSFSLAVSKQAEPKGVEEYSIPANIDTAELNKQLDSLIIDSQELKSPALPGSPDIMSQLQSPLPHFSFSFLQSITNNFCDLPLSEGGNKIGAGAFGTVYHGKLSGQLGLVNTSVAVKRILRDLVKNEEQFNNEVEIMSLVSHPNLLTLLAYSCDGDDLCLLYPYMENGSLEDRLAMRITMKPPLTPMQRLKISCGSAEGLQYLHSASHSKPLVHRDIKTANILLDSNNEPKVGDFGLVRLGGCGDGKHGTLVTQTVVGTSAYMAPEAVRGDVTVLLDVYSFGVVLLELLTSLPAIDDNRDPPDLVGYLEEQEEENDIEDLLDNKFPMMEWRQMSAKNMYSIAQKCLKKKKERPSMGEVVEMLYSLYN